ncbi:MAG TPA: response regulator [Gemmatimonadaceae bacterium]|nr:response regulator [Gemmatimonadaceae bacterium]
MSASSQPHVLIVEDNQLVIDALRVLFESAGRRVSGARSIAEAVRSIALDPPALALLDLRLPDGDGLSVVEGVRAHGGVAIALTGDDHPATRRRCLDAGCVDVLIKPVPVKELMAVTERWIA